MRGRPLLPSIFVPRFMSLARWTVTQHDTTRTRSPNHSYIYILFLLLLLLISSAFILLPHLLILLLLTLIVSNVLPRVAARIVLPALVPVDLGLCRGPCIGHRDVVLPRERSKVPQRRVLLVLLLIGGGIGIGGAAAGWVLLLGVSASLLTRKVCVVLAASSVAKMGSRG